MSKQRLKRMLIELRRELDITPNKEEAQDVLKAYDLLFTLLQGETISGEDMDHLTKVVPIQGDERLNIYNDLFNELSGEGKAQ